MIARASKSFAPQVGARACAPAAAVAASDVVVISVPWSVLPIALDQMGPLAGKIVVDTTNQFGTGPMPAAGQTAAAFNAGRMTDARYTKSFNTLTAGFQDVAAHRPDATRVVQWLRGNDTDAKATIVADCVRRGVAIPATPIYP